MWGHIHQIYTSTLLRSLKPYSPVHSRRSTCYAPLPPNSLVRRPDPAAVSPSPRRPRLLARRRAVPGSPPVATHPSPARRAVPTGCSLRCLRSALRRAGQHRPGAGRRPRRVDLVPVVVRVASIRPLLGQPRWIWSVTICC